MRVNDGAIAKAVCQNEFAGLLYGVQANKPKQRSIASLSAAVVVDAFRGTNDCPDLDWWFATSRAVDDLDPAIQVMMRSALQVRRAVCENNKMREMMIRNLKKYVE